MINSFNVCKAALSKPFSFFGSSSSFFNRFKEIRDIQASKKEEAKNLKSKIVSAKKVTISVDKNKSLESPLQPDLPNTSEPAIKEVESKEPIIEKSQEKTAMPSTELLDRALDDGSSLTEEELSQIASLLETKLEEFGIEATVESVLPGPVVTRFEIQPAPGTKASKITNIAQDIARSLSVSSVRVVEVIEGKSYVGIEIPNTNRKWFV